MTARPQAEQAPISTARQPSGRLWLLFVHQLPSHPSNLRVSTWRRLRQLGAIPLKQAVHMLPDSPGAREDFEWLKTEVTGAGGDASVFAATHLDNWSDDALVDEFRRFRQEAYADLADAAARALKRATAGRRPRGTRAPAIRRLLGILRERLTAIERVDFFASAGRDRVIALLRQLEEHTMQTTPRTPPAASAGEATAYSARLWITRPRPGVDRMSSAWLIRRFIDPKARFGFAVDRNAVPDQGVPFDMFGVAFSHQGDGCTFETLCNVFDLHEPALSRLAAIVHDLDLKDGRFGAPECATVSALIEGLQLSYQDDEALLAQGMTLFDSLYRSFERSVQTAGPRPLARPGRKAVRAARPRRGVKAR